MAMTTPALTVSASPREADPFMKCQVPNHAIVPANASGQ